MRMNLAVLDWNENVDRPHTSLSSQKKDLRRPDRRTPMKVLVDKKFTFVAAVWDDYVAKNKVDLMPLDDGDDADDNDDNGGIEEGDICYSSSSDEGDEDCACDED